MKESRVFWPLILFPFAIKNAHMRSYTGRYWLKNIKASFSFAYIELTELSLICRYRFFDLLIFNIDLSEMEEAKSIKDMPGLISIRFIHAEFGKLAKFALSGQPIGSKKQVILNVKKEKAWLEKLRAA
jgi:hypothetical protein